MSSSNETREEVKEITLYPPTWDKVLIVAIFVGGAIGSGFYLRESLLWGVAGMVGFGLLALATSFTFFTGDHYLKIRPEGFLVRSGAIEFSLAWAEVDLFFVDSMLEARYVMFRVRNDVRPRLPKDHPFFLRQIDFHKTVDGYLPDVYGGYSERKLAERMNHWRAAALGSLKP